MDLPIQCESIRERFPLTMSKDDFYKVAHISKRTAEYLLKMGAIPCEYTGKKTRCFKIRTEDVLHYLARREQEPEAYAVPPEWYREKNRSKTPPPNLSDELTAISAERGDIFRCFIETRLAGYSDLLGVGEVAEVTGYCTNHINNLCRRGSIKAFLIRSKYLIPKVTLIDYLANPAIYRRYCKAETAPTLARDFLSEYHDNAEKDSGNQI